MKNKIIISSILTIAMCVSLIAGSTFALFTSESKVNVAVSSATVSVTATPTSPEMGSTLGTPLGTATANGNSLTLENFVPGDYATFTINIQNNSDVKINYRTVLSVTEEADTALFEALEVYVGDQTTAYNGNAYKSKWTSLDAFAPIEKVTVKVLFPDAENNNDFMGKSCTITYMIEAVQGNTVPVESYSELLDNYYYESGSYTFEDDIVTSNAIRFDGNTTNVVNLQGNLTTTNTSMPVLIAQSGSDLTINAENDTVIDCTSIETQFAVYAGSNGNATLNGGTYMFGETTSTSSIYSQNNGLIVINDGNYISSDANTPILYCINGYIEINGGFFQNTANPNQALISCGNNIKYANNQKVTLSGGTFVNWNPMSSAYAQAWTNPDVPAMIVLADGYQMISETQANGDVWYMVVPIAE